MNNKFDSIRVRAPSLYKMARSKQNELHDMPALAVTSGQPFDRINTPDTENDRHEVAEASKR